MMCSSPRDAMSPILRMTQMSPLGLSRGGVAFHFGARRQDLVDQSPILCLFGSHEVVAIERLLDFLVGAAAMLFIDLVQAALHLDDVAGMTLDVGRLALETAGRLVNHDSGIRRGKAHVLV